MKTVLYDRSAVKHALQNTQINCLLTALECTKFVSAGALPRTPLGELTALLADLRGPTSKAKGERGKGTTGEGPRGGEEKGTEGNGGVMKAGKEPAARPYANSWIRPWPWPPDTFVAFKLVLITFGVTGVFRILEKRGRHGLSGKGARVEAP